LFVVSLGGIIPMVQRTIKDSLGVGAVAQTFLFHRHNGPRLDKQGKPAFILLRTLKGLKGDDPPPATPELVWILASSAESVPVGNTIGKLASGACCEYLNVSGKQKTKLLLLEDIQFHIANHWPDITSLS
jgi:hypothetical protein